MERLDRSVQRGSIFTLNRRSRSVKMDSVPEYNDWNESCCVLYFIFVVFCRIEWSEDCVNDMMK